MILQTVVLSRAPHEKRCLQHAIGVFVVSKRSRHVVFELDDFGSVNPSIKFPSAGCTDPATFPAREMIVLDACETLAEEFYLSPYCRSPSIFFIQDLVNAMRAITRMSEDWLLHADEGNGNGNGGSGSSGGGTGGGGGPPPPNGD